MKVPTFTHEQKSYLEDFLINQLAIVHGTLQLKDLNDVSIEKLTQKIKKVCVDIQSLSVESEAPDRVVNNIKAG